MAGRPCRAPPHWDLEPYAKNARTHSADQINQIAASMTEWGWTNPILVDDAGGVLAGHGRILAARQLGITDAPVMVARGWTAAQKRAYIIADNKLALNADWDLPLLSEELADLKALEFDLTLTGFDDDKIADMTEAPSPKTGASLGDVVYQVIVSCSGEHDQGELCKRLESEGYPCRLLTL